MKNKNTEAVYHIYVIIQYKVTGWPLGPWVRHKLPIMSSEQPCVWFVARACTDWKLQNTFRPRKEKRDTKTRLILLCLERDSQLSRVITVRHGAAPAQRRGTESSAHLTSLVRAPGPCFPFDLRPGDPTVQCPQAGSLVQCSVSPASHLCPQHPLTPAPSQALS